MTKSRATEPDAPRAYHRLSMQGRGPARPKPRPQANTLDAYLRPAPQPPVELAPLLQQMKTLFSVQPVSYVGSQPVSSPPVSSPPVSSPPTFNRIDNIKGGQPCPNKNCAQKVPWKKRQTIDEDASRQVAVQPDWPAPNRRALVLQVLLPSQMQGMA